jgi:hypothetical protein
MARRRPVTVESDTEPTPPEAPAPPTTELAPRALLGGLPIDDPTALQTELERYATVRGVFVDWLFSNLVAGVDYMLIHRRLGRGPQKQPCPNRADAKGSRCEQCGGKATLCKPGSEKLCGLLQLRPRFRRDVEAWEMLGSELGLVALVCELTTAADVVVAEGRGARHRDQDQGDVNKTVKMVQKSAQTDAVLRCAGLSELFSQDLEDMPAFANTDEESDFAAPRRASARPPDPDEGGDRELVERLQDSVDATAARHQTAPRPAARDREEPPPNDALSKARVARLYALIHEALREQEADTEPIFERVRATLKAWVLRTQGRSRLEYCSYRAYDELCAQVAPAVAGALEGGPRPRPRLVRR